MARHNPPPSPGTVDGGPEPTRIPHRVIRPRSGLTLLDLRELWDTRELLYRMGRRDVTLRYRQTALGITWVVLQPLLAAGIFTVVFSRVAKLPSDGVPYFVFAVAGMVVWNALSSTVSRASTSITSNATIVTRVFFPRILLPLSVTMAALVDAAVGWVLTVALLLAFDLSVPWSMCTFPLWLAATLVLAQGLGTAAAALAVRYRDVQYIVPVLLTFLLYASPVAYSLGAIPNTHHLRLLYSLNPLTGLLQGARWALLPHQRLDLGLSAYSVGCALVAFAIGTVIFERSERGFSDVI
jgi:lipopolysaccharide transport system permease protein